MLDSRLETIVPANDAQRRFGQLLRAVVTRGERIAIQVEGESVAALVPFDTYLHWLRHWHHTADLLDWAASNADLSDDEAEKLAKEAVAEVRRAAKV